MNFDTVYLSSCITYSMAFEGNVWNSTYQNVIYRLAAHRYFQSYYNSLHEDMQINSQSHCTNYA